MMQSKKGSATRSLRYYASNTSITPSTSTTLPVSYQIPLYNKPYHLIITHGQGVYLFAKDSSLTGNTTRRFLDLTSGIAVNALGYGDAQLTASVTEQTSKLVHLSNLFHNEYAETFAKTIVHALPCTKESCPGMGACRTCDSISGSFGTSGAKVYFCNSGTEANEAAIKFARKYALKGGSKEKSKLISFRNAFHGRTLGSLSATPSEKYQTPFLPLLSGFQYGILNDVEAVPKLIDSSVYAVFVEPIQGEGGVTPCTPAFLQALRRRCDEVGALLIFDEIQCGLARTGKLFAYQNFGVVPDMVTLAKPLAAGFPVGAVIASGRVADSMKAGEHGTTFGGSPFATKIGLDVFKRLQHPSFLSNVREQGAYFKSRLQSLASTYPTIVHSVRGQGLILGMQLHEAYPTTMFVEVAREQGVLVVAAGLNTIRVLPPLIIKRTEVDEACRLLEATLKLVAKKGPA